ncbi:hypothetical protein VVD49_03550 [Uliginosibacterium sp. H3]|uniref:Lipoprotein n=1 Tax=Uliginosibacterium silvisoli TaxID=3114758 RepID=A0ABU6K137_9RHOO|nr:hypothetical protein [Uliginosibacterium sp. H3]
MRIALLTCTLLTALPGCTAQSWYAGGQAGAEAECRRKPGDEMQRCLERLKKQDYRDYEKERSSAKPAS